MFNVLSKVNVTDECVHLKAIEHKTVHNGSYHLVYQKPQANNN